MTLTVADLEEYAEVLVEEEVGVENDRVPGYPRRYPTTPFRDFRPGARRATLSPVSQVGLRKRLVNPLVRVLLAVNQGLILDAGDHGHIDGCGAQPVRLIADIEHRCRSAIVRRQLHQVFAPCSPDIYDVVLGHQPGRRRRGRCRCRGGRRRRGTGRSRRRGWGWCGWSGGLRRLRLHTGKQQSRQKYCGGFAVHPVLPSSAFFERAVSAVDWFTLSKMKQWQKGVQPLNDSADRRLLSVMMPAMARQGRFRRQAVASRNETWAKSRGRIRR